MTKRSNGKPAQSVPEKYKAGSASQFHLVQPAFADHRRSAQRGSQVRHRRGSGKVAGVKEVFNEIDRRPRLSALGNRSNDSYITSKVKARLVDEKTLSANHIKVVTESGVTYLMGIVTEREAKVAVTIARTTDGVRKVVNVMEVLQRCRDQSSRQPTMGTPPRRHRPPDGAGRKLAKLKQAARGSPP
jgi:hypothetical protein